MKNLKEIRLKRGYTQESLATATGVRHSFICMMEGGRRKASIDVAFILADTLQVEVDDLFCGDNLCASCNLPSDNVIWKGDTCIPCADAVDSQTKEVA